MSGAKNPRDTLTVGDLVAEYRQLSHLHDQGAGPRPDWVDVIIRPLARELAALTGLEAQVGGPMGLGAHVTVSLKTPEDKTVHYLIFRPHHADGGIQPRLVDPSSDTGEYPPGTMGHKSSLHLEAVELPGTFVAYDVLEWNIGFSARVQGPGGVRPS